jgi:hypothetical protein
MFLFGKTPLLTVKIMWHSNTNLSSNSDVSKQSQWYHQIFFRNNNQQLELVKTFDGIIRTLQRKADKNQKDEEQIGGRKVVVNQVKQKKRKRKKRQYDKSMRIERLRG